MIALYLKIERNVLCLTSAYLPDYVDEGDKGGPARDVVDQRR